MRNDGYFQDFRAAKMNYADLNNIIIITAIITVEKLFMSILKDLKILYNLAKFH